MFGRWSDRVLPSILALALAPIAAAVAADADAGYRCLPRKANWRR